jgi:hypothetical protein
MLRAVPLFSTVALLLTLAGSTRGVSTPPTQEEERLFSDGLHAFDAGDARGAERAWKQGYAVAHDPAFLVRIGEAEEKAGAPAEAADSYRRYLREAPDASDRADIEQRLARLAPPPAAGTPSSEAARDFGGEAPASALPGLAGEPGPVGPAGDAEGARPGADDEDSGWTRANITAWSAAGATVLLLGTAGFFGAQASSKEGDVNRLYAFRDDRGAPYPYTPDIAQKYESAMADGRRYSRDAKIFLLAGAGTAAVACVFFVIDSVWSAPGNTSTAPATTPRLTLAPTVESRGAVAGWSWSF